MCACISEHKKTYLKNFFLNKAYERNEDWKTFLKDRRGRKTGTLSVRAFKRHIDHVLSIKTLAKTKQPSLTKQNQIKLLPQNAFWR